ncbi:MAG: ferrous iron transporter B [Smithella sp.]|nr:ferrous iron transporter B [Smithella sp.]
MARAAFIMDRVMHKIGLHGKSFIPMLIGFGCSVPAIMATRTLENRRDRLVTMFVTPLMSCGARLPIYALIIPEFFPRVWHAPMLWLIYVVGIALTFLSAKLLRNTILKGESVPFVMELPPYRPPTLKSVLIHMWERDWLYLKKAVSVKPFFRDSTPRFGSRRKFHQHLQREQTKRMKGKIINEANSKRFFLR